MKKWIPELSHYKSEDRLPQPLPFFSPILSSCAFISLHRYINTKTNSTVIKWKFCVYYSIKYISSEPDTPGRLEEKVFFIGKERLIHAQCDFMSVKCRKTFSFALFKTPLFLVCLLDIVKIYVPQCYHDKFNLAIYQNVILVGWLAAKHWCVFPHQLNTATLFCIILLHSLIKFWVYFWKSKIFTKKVPKQ